MLACWTLPMLFALGEKNILRKTVHKVLRSIPKRFLYKSRNIEETQDIASLKVDELFRSLFLFEMPLRGITEKKNKGISFQSTVEEIHNASKREYNDSLVDFNSMLSKQFNSVLKHCRKKSSNFDPKGNKCDSLSYHVV